MFTNAKTVIIDGNEVKSIITSDGGVLYEKPSDTHPNVPYRIEISTDQEEYVVTDEWDSPNISIYFTIYDDEGTACPANGKLYSEETGDEWSFDNISSKEVATSVSLDALSYYNENGEFNIVVELETGLTASITRKLVIGQ